ncbi:MAG: hypothetical protein JKY96_01105 [Phycisphaerales bacterium]|nr:hypothetical protein [Phycisphaerales bacterium]
MKDPKDIPLTRAIGQFFGHLFHATTKPVPTQSPITEVAKTAEQAEGEIAGQKVILRKTTIEEIEIRQDDQSPP